MPRINENASKVKNSSRTCTPDCENVKTLALLAQTKSTFLPKKIIPETSIGKSTNEGGINEQGIGNIDTSTVAGNNTSGSDNNIQSGSNNTIQNITQHNEHGKNIYAQTVNIYECPKELIELIKKL
jgi:hypothetical protein